VCIRLYILFCEHSLALVFILLVISFPNRRIKEETANLISDFLRNRNIIGKYCYIRYTPVALTTKISAYICIYTHVYVCIK